MSRSSCPICRSPHHRLGRRPALAALGRAPRAIAAAVARAPRRRQARRPAPGEWSVVEVLGHRRLSAAQRRRRGRHPEYGPIRVEQMLEHFAEHDLNHLDQIRQTLRRVAGR